MGHPWKHKNVELLYQSFGGGNRRLANGFLFFFRVAFQSMVLLDAHKFARRPDRVSFLRHIDVEAASRLADGVLIGLLPFFAQKPIPE